MFFFPFHRISSSSSDEEDYEEDAENKENVRYIIDGEP